MKKTIPRTDAKIAIVWIRRSISFFIKVSGLSMVVVLFAMVPKKVLSPIAMTSAFALPEVKLQPVLAIFLASVIAYALASGPNLISTFSPVKDELFTLRSLDFKIRRSAGTFSPETTLTISPRVKWVTTSTLSLPSLVTPTSFAVNL